MHTFCNKINTIFPKTQQIKDKIYLHLFKLKYELIPIRESDYKPANSCQVNQMVSLAATSACTNFCIFDKGPWKKSGKVSSTETKISVLICN